MPQFVVLRHDCPQGVHFDFMLETGGVLKTWALADWPSPGVKVECRSLADHRLTYLDYEGPISGDRGSVERCDRGTYTVERQSDAEWVVWLSGEKLSGKASVCRRADVPDRWEFSFDRPETWPSREA